MLPFEKPRDGWGHPEVDTGVEKRDVPWEEISLGRAPSGTHWICPSLYSGGLSVTEDTHVTSILSSRFLTISPTLALVAIPSNGCGHKACAPSPRIQRSLRWDPMTRNSKGPHEELLGFNYAPGPGLYHLTDSSLPCCHFGAVEFNLPDGK